MRKPIKQSLSNADKAELAANRAHFLREEIDRGVPRDEHKRLKSELRVLEDMETWFRALDTEPPTERG